MRNSPILSTDVNTTRVIDVSSSAGFSAGDLVYMQNGNGTSTPTTSSAVTFQAVKNLPMAISAHTGTAVMQVYDNTVNPSYAKNSATNGDSAALLTNGNTVHVVCDQGSGNRVLFTILDPNGVEVVSFTSAFTVSGAYSGPVASVCALTGGGFVVGGFNASGNPCYAIYDNAGVVVLAQTSYTGETIVDGSQPCCVFGLQNGNWVFAFRSSENVAIRFNIFSPTGTSILGWTTVSGSTSSSTYQIAATTRSDGSFVIGWINSGNTSIGLRQYDSAGTTLGANTITPSEASRSIRCLDLATMSDGSTVRCAFTYYQNDTSVYWKTSYATLTGTTLSAITNLSGQNLTQNTNTSPTTYNGPQSVGIIGLAGGTFLIAYQDMTATIGYAVFNSSGTCLTGTNANGAIPLLIYGSATSTYCVITMFEQGDYINLYYSHGQYSTNAPRGQCFSKINKTTYEVFYPYTVSQNIGSVAASAGAYVKSAAKPTQATFTTQSTFTSVLSRSVGLITDGNTATATSNPTNTSVALIKDGTIISAEHASTTLTIARYSNQGVYLSTIATVTGSGGYTRVRALADGGFVVMHYLNSTGTAQFLVYNSSFALVTSFSGGETISTSGTYIFDFDVLKSQNIVWCFQASATSYPNYKIMSLTGTTVVAKTAIASQVGYNIRVTAGVNDRFFVSYYYSGGNYTTIFPFIRTGASTWQNTTNWTVSYTGHDGTGINPTALPTGPVALFYPYNSTNTYIYIFDTAGNGINTTTGWNVSSGANNVGMAMTLTGLGTIAIYLRTTTNPEQCLGFMGNMGTMNVAYQFPSTNFSFSTSLNPTNNLGISSFCSAGLTNWFMFYTNASSVKAITLATSLPYANSVTFTQNVALCDPLSIYPNSTSASGIIPNCPLVGVALTAAPAGGVGRVVSSGATTLNTSYSATTPFGNFDHQTYGGMGVKGSISGRTVTLTGSN